MRFGTQGLTNSSIANIMLSLNAFIFRYSRIVSKHYLYEQKSTTKALKEIILFLDPDIIPIGKFL